MAACLAFIGMVGGYALARPAVANADLSIISSQIIHDVTVAPGHDNGSYAIGFSINAGPGPSTSFKYGIELVPVDNGAPDYSMIADEKIYDETVTATAGQTINRNIDYTPPTSLSGTYRMIVETKNESGLPLASAFAEDITLNSQQSVGISIDPASCFLSVENSPTHYNLTQGVDILSSEALHLSCAVTNLSKTSPIDATAVFNTNQRNSFGGVATVNSLKVQSVHLYAGQSETVVIDIPKPANPQAYDTTVVLSTSNLISSNPIIAHWVLHGDSATVQYVSLDKQSYDRGDTVTATFNWTGSASSFSGSRLGTSSTITSYVATANICDASQTINLDPSSDSAKVSLAIPASCAKPVLTIGISANDNEPTTLATPIPMNVTLAPIPENNNNILYEICAVIVAGIIAMLLGIVAIKLKKHKVIAMLLAIVSVTAVGAVHPAQAATSTTYTLISNTTDPSNSYFCSASGQFLPTGLNNVLGGTLFNVGDTIPIYQQPILNSKSYSCVTVPNSSLQGQSVKSLTLSGQIADGNISLYFSSKGVSKPVEGTSTVLTEYGQFDIVSNTSAGITSFESQSDQNLKLKGISAAQYLPLQGSTPAPVATVPNVGFNKGVVFTFNAYTFIGRTLLYNGSTLVAKSAWSQGNFWINPPAGGITLLPGGTATLGLTDPVNGNAYAFQLSMTNASYNPSVEFYPGETIYLKNILTMVLQYCTNGANSNLLASYQMHLQSVPMDASGSWTSLSNNGKDYLPTVNGPSAPLQPGSYFMDIKITQNINLEHQYAGTYQYGIVRIPFTVDYYPTSLNTGSAPCTDNSPTSPATVDLTWNNSITKISPFSDYIKAGYNVGYKIMRLKYGDTHATIATSSPSRDRLFSSANSESYAFSDTGLTQGTTYQYWTEWNLSKSGSSSFSLKDTDTTYSVTNSCQNPTSCNITSSESNAGTPTATNQVSWTSQGFDSCTINGEAVTPTEAGSMTVNPVNQTNYVLQCSSVSSPTCVQNVLVSPAMNNVNTPINPDANPGAPANPVNINGETNPVLCGAYDQNGKAISVAHMYQPVTWKVTGATAPDSWRLDGVATTTSQPQIIYTTSGVKYATANIAGGASSCNTSVTIDKVSMKEI
jgi:hypothetical protein